jgi:hypothetical protein
MTSSKSHQRTPKNRVALQLNPKLNSRLVAYATAASAAGVVLAALPPPATAEVVYTPANVSIGSPFSLDLNHDGIADFTLLHCRCFSASGHSLSFRAQLDVPGNGIIDEALAAGAMIGQGQPFITKSTNYGGPVLARGFDYLSISRFSGPFANATNKFLGLKFLIDGQVHYGWARLSVPNLFVLPSLVTGYAYETLPNHPIRAGRRTETATAVAPPTLSAPTSTPLSLGLLASGAYGLSPWRREQTIATLNPNQSV